MVLYLRTAGNAVGVKFLPKLRLTPSPSSLTSALLTFISYGLVFLDFILSNIQLLFHHDPFRKENFRC